MQIPQPIAPQFAMQIVVSISALTVALRVVLLGGSTRDKNWAYTTIGLIIGFWLRP